MTCSSGELEKVSVIVPTYRDWGTLEKCLCALANQTYPKEFLEVLVVNNEPGTTCPFPLPEQFIQVMEESRPGSYAARNAGIGKSTGSILAFTDSDCIPDADWIEEAVKLIQTGADRVAGKVELFYKEQKLTTAELYEKIFSFNQQANVTTLGAGVTANMIAKREVFNKVGRFNSALMSGGDMEWGGRARDFGFNIVFGHAAVVRHPARHKISDLLQKSRRVSGGRIHLKVASSGEGRLRIFRGILPPVSALAYIKKAGGLTRTEKLRVFGLAYLLKVHQSYHQAMLVAGFTRPTR